MTKEWENSRWMMISTSVISDGHFGGHEDDQIDRGNKEPGAHSKVASATSDFERDCDQ